MRSVQPNWRDSRPVWRLLFASAGKVPITLTLGFILSTACLRSWCQVFQLGALTALYNALVGGAGAASDALRLYLLASAISLILYLIRQGGSIGLELQVRNLLTKASLERYLNNRAYCALQRLPAIDHPDQRITEDAAEVAHQTTTLCMSFVSECISLISFLLVLAGASECLGLSDWGPTLCAVGFAPNWLLPALALATVAAGTLIGLWLGRHLAPFENDKERSEASLRRELLLIREQAEQISALREEPHRQAVLENGLGRVIKAQGRWVFARLRLEAFRITERDLTKLLPLAVVAWATLPSLSMGQVIQMVGAFVAVVDSGQWLVRNLSSFRILKAACWRLGTFLSSLVLNPKDQTSAQDKSAYMPDRTNTPTNFLLGEKIIHWAKQISELPISSGQWVLLEGASGSGKTSLLRALLEDVENGVLVPQTLQIPQGSLIEWLNPSRCLSQSELSHHLSAIGLHHLIPKLRVTACWGQILSGGEQQRLALLRAVLLKPSWLLLDEPLSMLDSTSTALVLQWLAKEGNARVLIATHKEIHKFSPEWALMFLDGGLHIRYQGSISAVMTGEAERSYPPGPVSKGSLRNIRQKQLPSENTLDCDSSALPTALQNHS